MQNAAISIYYAEKESIKQVAKRLSKMSITELYGTPNKNTEQEYENKNNTNNTTNNTNTNTANRTHINSTMSNTNTNKQLFTINENINDSKSTPSGHRKTGSGNNNNTNNTNNTTTTVPGVVPVRSDRIK